MRILHFYLVNKQNTFKRKLNFFPITASELTELIREEFPLSPIKFFKLFFSDASFTEKFRQQRGDTGNLAGFLDSSN